MARMKTQIIQTKELKLNYLNGRATERKPINFQYDGKCDILMISFIPFSEETIVHYIDEYIGVLFVPTTKEIVGFQIENFKQSFLPKHQGVRKVWHVNENIKIEYVDEVYQWFEKKKPQIIQAILKASENKFAEQGLAIKSLRNSFSFNDIAISSF